MGIIKEHLKSEGYNLRERFNIYSGALIGAAAPVVALRYLMFPSETKTTSQEIIAWASSFLFTLAQITPFSILFTSIAGGFTGKYCAKQLRRAREARESKLEKQV